MSYSRLNGHHPTPIYITSFLYSSLSFSFFLFFLRFASRSFSFLSSLIISFLSFSLFLSHFDSLLLQTARDAEIMGKGKDKEISSTTATTEESSLKLIFQSLKEDSQVADESLMSALRFLDKNYGRTTTTSVSSSSSSSSPAVSSSSNNADSTISEGETDS